MFCNQNPFKLGIKRSVRPQLIREINVDRTSHPTRASANMRKVTRTTNVARTVKASVHCNL